MLVLVLSVAFLLDLCLGDPRGFGAWHPVRWMGWLASMLDRGLHRPGWPGLVTGALLVLIELLTVSLVYLGSKLAVSHLPGAAALWVGAALDTFVLYVCIAFQDLFDHARPIETALAAGDLGAAQDAVQLIVGRDARLLDAPGVARAAIESVAESLSDGAVAPIFWFVVVSSLGLGITGHVAWAVCAGVVAALCFRAANTLDSMLGHRSERYVLFGRPAARLDDWLCFLPSRFAVLCLFLATALPVSQERSADGREGLRIRRRDGRLHPSPNAGQGESFVAGALGLKLGGPTIYAYGESSRPWLGDGHAEATAGDLRAAVRLVFRAGSVAVVLGALGLVAVQTFTGIWF